MSENMDFKQRNLSFFYTVGNTELYDAELIKYEASNQPMFSGGYAFSTKEQASAYIRSGKIEADFLESPLFVGCGEVDRNDYSVYEVCGNWDTDVHQEEGCDYGSLLVDVRVIGKRVTGRVTAESNPESELFSVCDLGCLPYVEELIESGVNVNSRNGYALQRAARLGHLDIVEYLVEKGADINANHPAREALFRGHTHVARFLLDLGAELGPIRWGHISSVDDQEIVNFLYKRELIDEEMFDRWLEVQRIIENRKWQDEVCQSSAKVDG